MNSPNHPAKKWWKYLNLGLSSCRTIRGEQQEDRTRRPRTETESATVEGDGLESLIPNWPVNGRALLEFSDRGYWEWKGSL